MQENGQDTHSMSIVEAKSLAQQICFAPAVFQAARVLRDRGILAKINDAGKTGVSTDKLQNEIDLSPYAFQLLLETAEVSGLVSITDESCRLTPLGYCILKDPMTRVNMDFMHDVCYEGMFRLEESLVSGKPAGLPVFGDSWNTIYEALASLPESVRKSWFAFDHFYSDNAFPAVLPVLFAQAPRKILDIGGNTGKWACACAQFNKDVHVTIVDHPGQLEVAYRNAQEAGFGDRIDGVVRDMLDPDGEALPQGYDAIWMSQFLDCFSPEEIHSILTRAREAMDESCSLYILETYVDRQQFEASRFSLVLTSLYFTTMANGNSRMYSARDMIGFVEEAGLRVVEEIDRVGIAHTLLRCVR
jgi:hypothetical protein